ncbi:hypothetical protein ACEPPN_009627 [Leptodophora sp. 'Broadleaf-Isolate-01']
MKTTILTTLLALTSTTLAASLIPRQTGLTDCTCQRLQNNGKMEQQFARSICKSDNPDYNGEFCRGLEPADAYTDAACVEAMGTWYTDDIKAEGAVWTALCRAPGQS